MGNDKHEKSSTMTPTGTCPEVYSNYVFLTGSDSDVRMLFTQTISREGGVGAVECEARAAVTVTWENAKRYRDALSQMIERYEAKNGEIRDPRIEPFLMPSADA